MTTTDRYGPTALATPANALTIARLAVTPVFVALILLRGASWLTSIVGAATAFSDGFDGVIARRQGATRSGAFLDPLADKIVVLASMYALVSIGKLLWVPVAIITLREAWMSVYRSRASSRGLSIPARRTAKLKTLVQDFSIGWCVLPPTAHLHALQLWTIWLAAAITVYTGYEYWRDGRRAVALVHA
ncbi:MAG TPA: CDP-alcohol phosphatidyltransferase family protein [Acidimicrobiales bacterium]|nr:CDP-alcohol phosphatidyltransferase family protein [Acidimicrobiales bacterium]